MANIRLSALFLLTCFAVQSSAIEVHLQAASPPSGIRVNETIHDSNVDLLFQWNECDFCASYEAWLHLEHEANNRSFTYPLRLGTTSLNVRDLVSNTKYHLCIKQVPLVLSDPICIAGKVSHIGYQSTSVRDLNVRPLSSRSLYVEWMSDDAEGFLVQIFSQSGVLVQEFDTFRPAKRSQIKVDNLEPGTRYKIQVSSFINPDKPGEPVTTSAETRTLPLKLPRIELRSKEKQDYAVTLLWNNPSWPQPVSHDVFCSQNGTDDQEHLLHLLVDGRTDSLTFASSMLKKWQSMFSCWLETKFSTESPKQTSNEVLLSNPHHPNASTMECLGDQYGSADFSFDSYLKNKSMMILVIVELMHPIVLNKASPEVSLVIF